MRIPGTGGMASVGRRGHLQNLADRLEPEVFPMRIDEPQTPSAGATLRSTYAHKVYYVK